MALCTIRQKGNITIAALPPQIDHVAAIEVEKELRELVLHAPKAILLDFSKTEYVSSSGLRVFLLLAKITQTARISFGVFSLTKFVDHIFAISGFMKVLPVYENEDAAVRAVTRA